LLAIRKSVRRQPTKAEQWVGLAVMIVIALFYSSLFVLWAAIPARGNAHCRRDIQDTLDRPFLESHRIRNAMGTRQHGDDWIVVMEAIPRHLEGNTSVLVVCRRDIGSFDTLRSVDFLDPRQDRHIRDVSTSVYRTWWPAQN
jgi:hypothetical protein